MADGLFEQLKNTSSPLPQEWQKLLTPGTAQYEAAILLNKQGKLPSISFNDKIKENGSYSKEDNALVLNSTLSSSLTKGTLAHELTHALRYKMQDVSRSIQDKLEKKVPVTTSEQQFFNSWQKLDPDFSKLPKFNYPDQEYNQYRHSFTEAPAWGVGRMEDPRQSLTRTEYWQTSPAGSHVDATMAQEQAILRDLYARTQQPQQQPTTPWYKDPFGFTIK